MDDTNLNARDLVALYVNARTVADLDLAALGRLRRELVRALAEVEDALSPAIVLGAARGLTYTELAVAAGYGSPTTITRIMKEMGASTGRGGNQQRTRRARRRAELESASD
jgi:hypothetical protein